MRNIWKGTDCTSLPRNLWYSNRKWKCIDDDFASSFCKIGIDCAFTISSTKSTPLLFLSFEYSADSIDSRWLLKKISEISVRRASLPIPRAVVVYSSQSFAKFHSRFDAHFSIVWFSRGENRNSNVLPVLIPARKKERDEWKTDTNVSIYCPGLIKVRQQAIDTFRFVLFFGFLSQGTFVPCPCFGLDYHYRPSLPRDHFQSSMLYLWSRFNGMDFLGEWLIRSSSNLNETTSQRFPR